jgi:Zn-dependent protease with chaperone function
MAEGMEAGGVRTAPGPPGGILVVVTDGMGGVAQERQASLLAKQTMIAEYEEKPEKISVSEIYEIALEMAQEMGIGKVPDIFIVNSEGRFNALAIRFIGRAFVILYANLVDPMLKRNAIKELHTVVAHDLAHHAAGHVTIFR